MDKARILIVEDDINLLEGVRTVLEIEGYSVMSAENGNDALRVLHGGNSGQPVIPDLIVSDIMMPQMDGIELLQAVRKEEGWVNIPFIFLTARGERGDVQRGKQLGVDDYLVKPFDPQDLLIAVEARLNRQRAINRARTNEVSDVKRRILTILNHEFRTPLTFVVAYADMLNEHEHSRLSDEDILTFLRGVNTGAVRLRRLIENFITLVEFEMGEAQRNYELRRAPMRDVTGILRSLMSNINEELGPRNFVTEIAPDLPVFWADAIYLQLALGQILDNAIKFSTENSTITIRVQSTADEIIFSVRDEGRGIPQNELDRIWGTFYQINRAEYEDQGAGSGLAIVNQVVRLHGGRLLVQSEHGQGSTFGIALPVGPATPEDSA